MFELEGTIVSSHLVIPTRAVPLPRGHILEMPGGVFGCDSDWGTLLECGGQGLC